MAIPHSLEAVILAVQTIIDGREIPTEWKTAPTQGDFSISLFDILQQAKEAQMDRAEFEALDKDEKTRVLAEHLAKLSTKQANTAPLEETLARLTDVVTLLNERVGMIETAIFQAGQKVGA